MQPLRHPVGPPALRRRCVLRRQKGEQVHVAARRQLLAAVSAGRDQRDPGRRGPLQLAGDGGEHLLHDLVGQRRDRAHHLLPARAGAVAIEDLRPARLEARACGGGRRTGRHLATADARTRIARLQCHAPSIAVRGAGRAAFATRPHASVRADNIVAPRERGQCLCGGARGTAVPPSGRGWRLLRCLRRIALRRAPTARLSSFRLSPWRLLPLRLPAGRLLARRLRWLGILLGFRHGSTLHRRSDIPAERSPERPGVRGPWRAPAAGAPRRTLSRRGRSRRRYRPGTCGCAAAPPRPDWR